MAKRLTDRLIRKLAAPGQGSRFAYDDVVRGFGIRITSTGCTSFVLRARVASGRERVITIGRFPDFSATAARERAKALKRRIADGEDPMAKRQAMRAAPTINELWDRYKQEHLPKKRPKSQENDHWIMDRRVGPRLGKVKVAAVTRDDIEALHRRLSGDAPIMANRVVAFLSMMFSCSIKWGYRTDNPARGVERNPESGRTRYLSSDELGRLIPALDAHPDQQAADIVRLLFLTGARKGEVLGATWDQFDLAKGVWTKPGATTKQKTEHRVPLSAPALKLLVGLQERADGPHLFPGRVPGKPRLGLKKFWSEVRQTAEIDGCRIHDLRHTFASILASYGLSLPIIGALLGHTQPATTARYAHLFDDPLRAATERVASFVTAAVDGREGEVIDLKTAKKA